VSFLFFITWHLVYILFIIDFIEKNALVSIEEYFNDLGKRKNFFAAMQVQNLLIG
jgi:hypothetical protein